MERWRLAVPEIEKWMVAPMSKHGVISLPFGMGKKNEDALQLPQGASHLLRGQPPDFALIHLWRLALSIESDAERVDEWYRSTPIRELGGLTAQQLVAQGDSTRVIHFLHSIRRSERD